MKSLLPRDQFECELVILNKYVAACEAIKGFLNEAEFTQLINTSPFGWLIIASEEFQSAKQIMWFMMRRQSELHEKEEVWMIVNKTPIRFLPKEYSLISGLKWLDVLPEIAQNDDFRRRHFGKNKNPRDSHLKSRFTDLGGRRSEEVDVEKVKLANLYFLTFVLGPRRSKKDLELNTEWMSLLEDDDAFREYPWGTVGFREALGSIKRDLRRSIEDKKKKDEKIRLSFTLSGFIEPLQVIGMLTLNLYIFNMLNI